MALQGILGTVGFVAEPFNASDAIADSTSVLDAAGESVTAVGYVHLSTGPGTSKVLSAAGGGKIAWRTSTVTFADAGSNLRIGVQDVSAGIEDGTFDVYADLVGGTDTIGSSASFDTAMETGTKTIAHGDLIAISIELTARGGADSVVIRRPNFGFAQSGMNGYMTVDSGSGPARIAVKPGFVITFDDGTIGWIRGGSQAAYSTTTFGADSTPDEYALIFQVPYVVGVGGVVAVLDNVASGDTLEFVLYSDPLGASPQVEAAVTINPDLIQSATLDARIIAMFSSEVALDADTNYAVSVRPTSANTVSIAQGTFASAAFRAMLPFFGTKASQGTRSNNTGAFAQVTTIIPQIGPIFTSFDDGTAVGGGSIIPIIGGGGLVF